MGRRNERGEGKGNMEKNICIFSIKMQVIPSLSLYNNYKCKKLFLNIYLKRDTVDIVSMRGSNK
ncbi:MAG: hypothetical protein WB392_15465 [Methanotrichaceae archaeon]